MRNRALPIFFRRLLSSFRFLVEWRKGALFSLGFGAALHCVAAQPDSVTTNYPVASGTLSYLPELCFLDRAPVGDDVQSVYFKTTSLNRELRRGYIEFRALNVKGYLRRATLVLYEWRGVSRAPVPPVIHELSFYSADLAITTNDFTQTKNPLLFFRTDENEDPKVFEFDVTRAVLETEAKPIGFQIKVNQDTQIENENSFGTGFEPASSRDQSPRLILEMGDQPTPSIFITNPLLGQEFTAPQNIPIQAAIRDPQGSIRQLEFFANNRLIGMAETNFTTAALPGQTAVFGVVWTNIAAGVYGITAKGRDNQNNEIESDPIQVTVIATTPIQSSASRNLPLSYFGGDSITVRISTSPQVGTKFYALEDQAPMGWTILTNNSEGVFDSVNRKMKFGPYTDDLPRLLQYTVLSPKGSNSVARFSGTASFDGTNSVILGDLSIAAAILHPADKNPRDERITLQELTAYGKAWKSHQPWPGESTIQIDNVTRAAFIWKSGEFYKFDPTVGPSPLWWTVSQKLAAAASVSENTITRTVTVLTNRQTYWIEIEIHPKTSVRAYAAMEKLPLGVAPLTIPGGAIFDSSTGEILWGPYLDSYPRVLAYELNPSISNPDLTFSLTASFDGTSVILPMDRQKSDNADIIILKRFQNGDLEISHNVPDKGQSIIEESVDLKNWNVITNLTSNVPIRLTPKPTEKQQFYRSFHSPVQPVAP
jgi:hypothetical protein